MSEAKCPECDLAQHRGDCFDDEIDARLSKSLRAEGERLREEYERTWARIREREVERLRKLLSLDPNGAELARIYDGWTESMARAEKAERERDEAKAQLLAVKEFSFKDGDFDAAFVGEGAAAIAMTLIGFYREQKGENYVEMQFGDKKTGERFTVTVQRVAGKTPHELRSAAEARAETLAAALREIQEGKGPFDRDNHKFACNVIESMKAIAALALADGEEK